MKKTLSLMLATLFLFSCATSPVVPVGTISKVTGASIAIIDYPEANLQVGQQVRLVRVYWTMGRRNESTQMTGVVEKNLGGNAYEVKFDGTKKISETNIVRK